MDETIFVLGGGGFSMEPENPLLDQYVLDLSPKKEPEICFVPTASADSEEYTNRFHNGFQKHGAKTSALPLFRPPSTDLEDYVLSKDIIYVGGGNTKNLLCLWKEWGLDLIFKKALSQGVIFSGISAGMICWFEEGLTDSFGNGTLASLECLGFLKGSACPHFDGEVHRRSQYAQLIATREMKEGLALDDSVGALFKNGKLVELVSSVKGAKGYEVSWENSQSKIKNIQPRFLG